ncbi:MAG: hypothetical protein MR598_01670 [Erysipelotrichaceae bacterium]|nr:hypothetical protein [Erysipelotrichaceae bacterium]
MEQEIRGNNNWANHYLQRLALLKDFEKKVGEDNVPDSIKEEKFLLDNLVNKLLVQSQNKGYNSVRAIGNDGVSIRCSKEEYEEAKSKLSKVQGENGKYITEADEKSFNDNFKWDSIPSHRIGAGAGVEAIEDYIKNELDGLNISAENYMDYYELRNEIYNALTAAQMNESKNKLQEEADHRIEGGQVPVVSQSTFKQIYDNAKGKVKAMFSAIKNRFNSKNQDQVKENEEDERE